MTLNDLDKKTKDLVVKHFDYTVDFDFLDVVADIIYDTQSTTDYSYVLECVDESLIYSHSQWIVAKHYYSSPIEIKQEDLYDKLIADIIEINKLR